VLQAKASRRLLLGSFSLEECFKLLKLDDILEENK
jgi:hypothetical protein